MTVARQVLPGTTLLITRRCFGRMFLLRPSKQGNDLFRYILAVAAGRFGVLIHAYCVLSNHFHCVLTDPKGNLPRFEQYLDGLVARSFNALHGRWESFWAPGSYSAVCLATPADVLDKAAYVLANPVAAGLVRRGAEWPGLWAAAGLPSGVAIQVKRPEGFFRPDGPLPPSATLALVCPPGFESMDAFRESVAARAKVLEDRAARKLAAERRSFLGVRAAMAQRPTARPAVGEPRRGLNPRVGARDKWKRIEAILRLKKFVAAYREAWSAFARGLRETVFPAGTYWMRVAHGVKCAGV
jgi:REP element-mobilizing transposase RayT